MIEIILNWFKANPWIYLVVLGISIGLHIAVFIFNVSRKPVKVIDSVKEALPKVVLELIDMAENAYPNGNGEKKKAIVLDAVRNWLFFKYGKLDNSDIDAYVGIAAGLIEDILSTPQKKGEK